MNDLHQNKILPYPAKDLFALVLDVESYQEFLPWCKNSIIISQNEQYIIAELVICYKGFTDKYRSKISTNISNEYYEIDVEAISGPFKFLRNNWKFYPKNESCKVEFMVSFEFKNIILDKLMKMFFKNATEKMVDAFEQRAKIILSH